MGKKGKDKTNSNTLCFLCNCFLCGIYIIYLEPHKAGGIQDKPKYIMKENEMSQEQKEKRDELAFWTTGCMGLILGVLICMHILVCTSNETVDWISVIGSNIMFLYTIYISAAVRKYEILVNLFFIPVMTLCDFGYLFFYNSDPGTFPIFK